jgi:hypothetical protein
LTSEGAAVLVGDATAPVDVATGGTDRVGVAWRGTTSRALAAFVEAAAGESIIPSTWLNMTVLLPRLVVLIYCELMAIL